MAATPQQQLAASFRLSIREALGGTLVLCLILGGFFFWLSTFRVLGDAERARLAVAILGGWSCCALSMTLFGWMAIRAHRKCGAATLVLDQETKFWRRVDVAYSLSVVLLQIAGVVFLSLLLSLVTGGGTKFAFAFLIIALGLQSGHLLASARWPSYRLFLCEHGILRGWRFIPWERVQFCCDKPSRIAFVFRKGRPERLEVPTAIYEDVRIYLKHKCEESC